jgi:immune inhibitor A
MWHSNKLVLATYAYHTSQWAWANIEGVGWLRVKDGAADGVTNLFVMLNAARSSGRRVSVYVDGSNLITTAYLL